MNSRERRKLDAQYHNDKIDYAKWLFDKTKGQVRPGKILGRTRISDRASMMLSALALSGVVVIGDD